MPCEQLGCRRFATKFFGGRGDDFVDGCGYFVDTPIDGL